MKCKIESVILIITLSVLITTFLTNCKPQLIIKSKAYFIPMPDKNVVLTFVLPQPKIVNSNVLFTLKDFKELIKFFNHLSAYIKKLEYRINENNKLSHGN